MSLIEVVVKDTFTSKYRALINTPVDFVNNGKYELYQTLIAVFFTALILKGEYKWV